jgi:capsule polysaccharide export protein KpsE/RkpR
MEPDKNDVTFLKFLLLIARWKRLIVLNAVIFFVVTAAYSLIMPKTFRSVARILPEAGEGVPGIASFLSTIPLGGLSGQALESTANILAILKSRSVHQKTIEEFDLIEYFEVENMDWALMQMDEIVSYLIEEEGAIVLEVRLETGYFHPQQEEDFVRNRVAEIANFMVSEADEISKTLESKRAGEYRKFVEKRYQENLRELTSLEDRMRTFQETNSAFALPEQIVASIEAAAELHKVKLQKEIELELYGITYGSEHPAYKMVKAEVDKIDGKLQQMMGEGDSRASEDHAQLFPSFGNVPELAFQYYRLERDLEIQSLIFQYLAPLYEQAKLQEIKEMPAMKILDPAVPPMIRSWPARSLMVIGMTFLSFFVSAVIILYFEFKSSWMRDAEKQELLMELKKSLRFTRK